MKKLIFLFCFFSLLFVCAEDVGFCNFLDVRSWGKSPTREVVSENGKRSSVEIRGPAFVQCNAVNLAYPIDGGNDPAAVYEGISFEVKGDGSDEYGNIILGESYTISGRYYFSLKNRAWQTIRIAFADMAPGSDHVSGLPKQLAVGRIAYLAFGDYEKLSMRNRAIKQFSYQIRNLCLIKKMDSIQRGEYKSLPLAEVIKLMKTGKRVLITGFGDSITAGTGLKEDGKRYIELLAEKLADKYQEQ